MSLNSMCASMVAAGMVVYMEPSLFADSTDWQKVIPTRSWCWLPAVRCMSIAACAKI